MIFNKDNMTILFIGDSITDCGRDRSNPEHLGGGYPSIIAEKLRQKYVKKEFRFLNLGISGNSVLDLQKRWESDCIAFNPDIVSILVGINDVWRRYDSNSPVSKDDFYNTYKNILTQTKKETDAKIIMMEPFLMINSDKNHFREDLDPKIMAVRELALGFAVQYIPLDGMFASLCCANKNTVYSEDGIHPTDIAAQAMSKAWLNHTLKV
jgi:lysophospholipase L1-like esterase